MACNSGQSGKYLVAFQRNSLFRSVRIEAKRYSCDLSRQAARYHVHIRLHSIECQEAVFLILISVITADIVYDI